MDQATSRRLVEEARVAVLATLTSDGRPHLVPCCFVLDGVTIYSAVDAKPKTTMDLRRLSNLRANPHASLLIQHYDEDWSELWWVRVDGQGRILEPGEERDRAVRLLSAKYPPYREAPPPGEVLGMTIDTWRSWP
ncbi:MAG TPA: TIGR03668 family PPOX class F420-dependent oxidoreductase [Acidimicrobiales bacterium]|nr:TIGR03668 family PPOX class F420-dependent oxidoreductase [Acidimicrobiales bacterium]